VVKTCLTGRIKFPEAPQDVRYLLPMPTVVTTLTARSTVRQGGASRCHRAAPIPSPPESPPDSPVCAAAFVPRWGLLSCARTVLGPTTSVAVVGRRNLPEAFER